MATKIIFVGDQLVFKELLNLLQSQKTYTDGIKIFNIQPDISSMPDMKESDYGSPWGPPHWEINFYFEQQLVINSIFCLTIPRDLSFMFGRDDRPDHYVVSMIYNHEYKTLTLDIGYKINNLSNTADENIFKQTNTIPHTKDWWQYIRFDLNLTPILHSIMNTVLSIPAYGMISHAVLASILIPSALQIPPPPINPLTQQQFKIFASVQRTLVFSQNSTFGSALIDFCRQFRISFIIIQQNRNVWIRDAFFECTKNGTPRLYVRKKEHPIAALNDRRSVVIQSNIIHPYSSRGGLLLFTPKILSDDTRQVNLRFTNTQYVRQTAKSLEGGNLFLVQNKVGKVFAVIGLLAVYHDEHMKSVKEGVRTGFTAHPELTYAPLQPHPTKPGKMQLPNMFSYSHETSRTLEQFFQLPTPSHYQNLQAALSDQELLRRQHPKYSELFRTMVDEIIFVDNLTYHIDLQMCYLGQGIFFIHSFDVLRTIFPDYYATYVEKHVHGVYEQKVNQLISILHAHGFIAIKFCGHIYKKNSNLAEIVWDCDKSLDSTLVNGIDVYSPAQQEFCFVANDTPNEAHKEHFEDTIAQIVAEHNLSPIKIVYLCAQDPIQTHQDDPRAIFSTRYPQYTPAETVEHIGKYAGGIRCQTNFIRTDAIDTQSFEDTEALLRETPYSYLPCTACGADLLKQPAEKICIMCGSPRV